MNAEIEKTVAVCMPKGTLLVLFEYLSRSYDSWRAKGQTSHDRFAPEEPDEAERVALWRLEGEIERTLTEVFAPNYAQLVADAKSKLVQTLDHGQHGQQGMTNEN